MCLVSGLEVTPRAFVSHRWLLLLVILLHVFLKSDLRTRGEGALVTGKYRTFMSGHVLPQGIFPDGLVITLVTVKAFLAVLLDMATQSSFGEKFRANVTLSQDMASLVVFEPSETLE